jgi:hypothetical protein
MCFSCIERLPIKPSAREAFGVVAATTVRRAARETSYCIYKAVSTCNRLNIKPAKSTANHDVLNRNEQAITTNHVHCFSHRIYDWGIRSQY